MLHLRTIYIFLALCISSSVAFVPVMHRWVQRSAPQLRANSAVKGSKPDLFSGKYSNFYFYVNKDESYFKQHDLCR